LIQLFDRRRRLRIDDGTFAARRPAGGRNQSEDDNSRHDAQKESPHNRSPFHL